MNNKRILILNHVFWPDKHNTARHISELAYELVCRGWYITALVGNRSYLNYKKKFNSKGIIWNGVNVKRIYIPPLNQKKNLQRLLTSFWILLSWCFHLPFIVKFRVIIIGTNPPFSYLIIPVIKLFKPSIKIVLWGFDLYPEAIISETNKIFSFMGKIIKPVTILTHRFIDVIVDIGPCMKAIYESYRTKALKFTLTPWSFIEPPFNKDYIVDTKKKIFGDSKIGLLYSGTLGYAHDYELFLKLARRFRELNCSIAICFAGFGSRFLELKNKISTEDTNIYFANFTDDDKELENRILSADFFLISLKESWTGISIPSKFFGAIACGKPVIFSGPKESSIAKWIEEYKLGYCLNKDNIDEIAYSIIDLINSPDKIKMLQLNAYNTYHKYFSKKIVCDGWDKLLNQIIEENY